MNFEKKLIVPKMNKDQRKVYSYLKQSKLHWINHWSGFSNINKHIDSEIKDIEDECIRSTMNKELEHRKKIKIEELELLKKKLVFERLKEYKEDICENSSRQSLNKRLLCFYCEEIMDDKKDKMNNCYTIEHIIDKGTNSKYSFAPFNLIPICKACNTFKGTLQVLAVDDNTELSKKQYLIVHPYIDNKSDFLKFNGLSWEIVDTKNQFIIEKAQNTIEYYNLLRTRSVLKKDTDQKLEDRRIRYSKLFEKEGTAVRNLIKDRNHWIGEDG